MLCPTSCLPLLRELHQWRCLLAWHRHHAGSNPQQQTSDIRIHTAIEHSNSPSSTQGNPRCLLFQQHTEKPVHDSVCAAESCRCPGASCSWLGGSEALVSHLLLEHESISMLQGEEVFFVATDIDLLGTGNWLMVQSCFSCHFLLILVKQEINGHQKFFAIVLLIGTRERAESFVYRLELSGHRRRLTWEAMASSIYDGVTAAIENRDCLVFDASVTKMFAEKGSLKINVKISMG